MRTEYGDSDVDLVHNGVSHEQFHADIRGKQAVPTLGFLYHTAPFKGVDVTIRAIEWLTMHFPRLHVVSFGAQRLPRSLRRLEFHYLPAQNALRQIYAKCDVWLTASRSEGFNLPAMEAMACRTPVVSTRTGWPQESIKDGQNGFLVDVDDADSLARGAASILNLNDEAWRQMSTYAYQTVADKSWDAACDNFERALVRARDVQARI
jgi:glycosyltransferase involved in cell wall biosynthesis